jgi:hypothetical protein
MFLDLLWNIFHLSCTLEINISICFNSSNG